MSISFNTNSNIAIIGLGYVGLPLAVEFGKKYSVIGFDINTNRIDALNIGEDETLQSNAEEIKKASGLRFSTDLNAIKNCTIFIVTVPTPVDENKTPNLQPLLNASKMIGSILKKGDLVIYESTVYPGCTEEDCVPVLEKESGLQYNQDFFCGVFPRKN